MRNLLALSLVLLAGCATRAPVAVEIERGVPASQLALRITETHRGRGGDHPIEMITLVESIDDEPDAGPAHRPFWFTAHVKGQPYLRPPLRLKMGDSVPGYATSATIPLALGRYEARVNVGGVMALAHFRVNERGMIE